MRLLLLSPLLLPVSIVTAAVIVLAVFCGECTVRE